MEQLDYNLLFRWFVGLNTDDPVWVPTVFHNRDRLLEGEIVTKLFGQVLARAEEKGLEEVADGGAGRPSPIEMAPGKQRQEFLRAPGRMALARFNERLHYLLGRLGRADVRAPGGLGQARGPSRS
jgi:hypothetical protein